MKTLTKMMILPVILFSTASFADGAPYVGASIGIQNLSGNEDSFNPFPSPFNVSAPNNSSHGNSAVGTLFGGYGITMAQHYYLAAEIFGDHSSKLTNVGVSLIPGIKLNDKFMVYGRVGGIYAANSNSTVGHDLGLQVGGGIQLNATKNIGIRTEYDYATYATTFGGSPHTQAVNLGLVYTFG